MEFYSAQFVLFVITALLLHEIAGRCFTEKQWIIRLAASMLFIIMLVKWNAIFVILCAVSVFFGTKHIQLTDEKSKKLRKQEGLTKEDKNKIKEAAAKKKKVILTSVLVLNLLVLAVLKYIVPEICSGLLLPLGISYYTFMAISYLLDVYGGKYKAEDNFFKILLYLCWFPQLIQGPINRYDKQNANLFGKYSITWDHFKNASFCFLFGALKKYAIANLLNYPVARVFDGDLSQKAGSFLLLGAFMFAIQQYADFSGGIDMVMGVSSMFGIHMDENFRQPYFSRSIAQFWRRWHITLGGFMRDYVFYPFALSKPASKLMKKITDKWGQHYARAIVGGIGNLLVFTLVGLWHGAKLHYIIWGLYNGLIIAFSDLLSPSFDKLKAALHIKEDNKAFIFFQMLRTFFLIVIAGYFDRIEDVRQGFICIKNTFFHFNLSQLNILIQEEIIEWEALYPLKTEIIVVSCIILLIFSILKERGTDVCSWIKSTFLAVRWTIVYVMLVLVMAAFAIATENAVFMYANF